jgi:hypothetical protein
LRIVKELKGDSGVKRKVALTAVVIALALLAVALPSVEMFADGTETLGPPNIPIASGSGFVAAGTGLEMQPGSISIDVPAGATVKQVLLYWSGGVRVPVGGSAPVPAGDDVVSVNGTGVTGALIGGSAYFYTAPGVGDFWFASYRADITGLGLVGPGTSTLTIEEMDFGSNENNGAGVLVIYDDGSGTAEISVRDGLDLAFVNFPEPRKSTVAQTFFFSPATVDRIANLSMFFGSVSNDGLRPNSIEVTVAGVTTVYSDLLASNDGPQWDTVNLTINIPAGADSLTVQAFSRDDNNTGALPASFSWIGAGLSVPPPPPPGGEGCTPGAWQGGNGKWRWDEDPDPDWNPPNGNPFYHDTLFNGFFTPWGSLDGLTMYDLVRRGGGKDDARKAARSLVAAYLNASHDSVDYPLTTAELFDAWDDAVAGNTAFIDLHTSLDTLNNLGCELD